MTELTVGVRELKTQLSKYLRYVKDGRVVVITERGKPVGRLVPAEQSVEQKMWAMVEAGLAEWNGEKLKPMKPVARVKEGHSVAQIIIDDRR